MSALVVDSDQIFREFLINLLLIWGVTTFEVASNGQEAMAKLSKKRFDVILINFFLPDTTGLHLAGALQNRKPDSKIILIIEDDQMPLLNNAGLVKPNFPTILKSSVEHMLPQFLSGA